MYMIYKVLHIEYLVVWLWTIIYAKYKYPSPETNKIAIKIIINDINGVIVTVRIIINKYFSNGHHFLDQMANSVWGVGTKMK